MESVTDSSSNYLSSHVRNTASLVYSEFERLVARYGEGVVDGIVPIMIQTLEQVDQLHEANELLQASCAQDELRVESLTLKLDREIKARRAAEERVIALEDEIAEVTIRMNEKFADSTRLIRVLEAKCAAANEHVIRQEAKEAELQWDLANAQNRCNELLRSHVAHVERVCNHVHPLTTERSLLSEFRHITPKESISHRDPISPTKDNTQLSPTPSLPSSDDDNPGEPVFDTLEETTDYEQYLSEQPQNWKVSGVSDPISEASDGCDFLGSKSLEAEVKKLLAENQELTEMKRALNILKDDLLTRIDDLSGHNIILKSDLKICQEELVTERKQAKARERQLMQRIQHLTSRLRAMEKLHEGRSGGAFTRCASLDLGDEPLTVQASRRRRTHSCSAALPTMKLSKPEQQQRSDSQRAPPDGVVSDSSSSSGRTLKLTKREIARILVERNYYKEHYLEAKNRLYTIEDTCRAQALVERMRKREIASALLSRIFQSVHNFASDVAQGFDELIAPVQPPPPSRTSIALWNILGNFVGQAVTYTADAVIGTGHDLPLDVSRPVIAANINSRLPIAPPQRRGQSPS
ncbi:C Jun amino terminal kinase interacting protein [Echinococcus multilocularis]|uniref:C Jun amino terminal kinase interacting protein n=1 Tax=Echinococcus multilocularis TaxID=6211 RepID=A0A068XYT9_ECHMU|nr:C Jun amino terminal kinase interacting protein [Echinococcus multilocularis]